MPLPTPTKNPLFNKLATDGLFSRGGPGATYDMGSQTDFGQQNAEANVMGSGLGAPYTGAPIDMPAVSQNVMASGMSGVAVNPIHAYAPTGLRERAINAPINPNDPSMRERSMVWGQGDVMAGYDGMNAAGGRKFSLGQVMPVGGTNAAPVDPQNPIAPETLQPMGIRPVSTPQNNPQSPNAGLLAAFDPNSPMSKYVKTMDAARRPVDMEHLKLLTTLQKNETTGALAERKVDLQAKGLDSKIASTEQKLADAAKADEEKVRQVVETADNVMGTIDQITPLLNEKTTGIVGAGLANIPGTDAFKVAKLKDMVLANIGISQLQAMRTASKNGASGFGALSEKELDLLQASLGSLKQAQGIDEQKAAYAQVRHHFDAWKSSFAKGKSAADLGDGWSIKN